MRTSNSDPGHAVCVVIGPLVQVGVSQLEHFAGDTVTFECPLRGLELEPGYQVVWGRVSATLPFDRVNFTCDNESLILVDARAPEDIGNYFCEVQEPSGRIFRFTVLLTIFGKCHPHLLPPSPSLSSLPP